MMKFLSWLFGIIILGIGLINIFWGNDIALGLAIIIISCIYFPPLSSRLEKFIGGHIPLIVKILIAIAIFWISLGVGDLNDKIDMMMIDML